MNLLLSLLLAAVPAWGRVSPSRRRSGRYYAGVSLSGAVASSTTHVLVLPLDVVKTRMQTGSRLGLMTAAGAVLADAPGRGLFRLSVFLKGLPPTAVGYFLQAITDERVGERTGLLEPPWITLRRALGWCQVRRLRGAEAGVVCAAAGGWRGGADAPMPASSHARVGRGRRDGCDRPLGTAGGLAPPARP